MTIPVTTRAVKGSPLTTVEMDSNLDGLARDATEIQQGNVQFATEAQTEALTADGLTISPLNLPFGIEAYADALAKSLTTPDGYITLPSGLVVQWGQISCGFGGGTTTTAVTFPVAFSNNVLTVMSGDGAGSVTTTGKNISADIASWSISGFDMKTHSNNVFTSTCVWLAIGY